MVRSNEKEHLVSLKSVNRPLNLAKRRSPRPSEIPQQISTFQALMRNPSSPCVSVTKERATGRWLQRGWIVRRCASEWRRSSGGKWRKREKRGSRKKTKDPKEREKKSKENATSNVVDDCTVIGSPISPYPLHLALQSSEDRRHSAVLITLTYGRRTPRRGSTLLPRVRRIMATPGHCLDRKSY